MWPKDWGNFYDKPEDTADDCAAKFVEFTTEIYTRIYWQELLIEPIFYAVDYLTAYLLFGFQLSTFFYNTLYNGLTIHQMLEEAEATLLCFKAKDDGSHPLSAAVKTQGWEKFRNMYASVTAYRRNRGLNFFSSAGYWLFLLNIETIYPVMMSYLSPYNPDVIKPLD